MRANRLILLLIPLAVLLTGCRIDVSVLGTGGGSVVSSPAGISCDESGGTCSAIPEGGMFGGSLTATPDVGSVFAGYTGCSAFPASVNGNVCSGTIDPANAAVGTVSAEFTLTWAIALAVTGDGSGSVSSDVGGLDCTDDCTVGFAQNSAVTLTASPADGSTFEGWSGACSGTGTCGVTTDGIENVSASFSDIPDPVFFDLSVGIGGHGSGSVISTPDGVECTEADECVVQFEDGAEVALTATPAQGSTFTGWDGAGCTGTGSCTVTMTEARQVLATFELIPAVHEPAPAQTTAPAACGAGDNSITCGVRPGETQTITLGDGTPASRITVELEGADGAGTVTMRTVSGDTSDGVLGDIVELDANGFQFSRAKVCLPGPDPELLEELQLRLGDLQIVHDHEGDQNRMEPMAPDASGRVCVVVGEFSKFWVTFPERMVRSTNGGSAATAASWAIREHGDGAKTVYLASSAQTVDALLAASGLRDSGIPLLLTDADALPAATRKALNALEPDRIVVFGGSSAVGDAVLAEAAALTGATVSRVAGADRAETAAAVSRLGHAGAATHVYLVNGDTGADLPGAAAAAAHEKAAVLLTSADGLPAATAERLAQLSPTRVTVVGGRAAVSDAVLDTVRAITGAEVERVSGPNRHATASALTRQTFRGDQAVAYVTDGTDAGAVATAVAAAAGNGSALVVTEAGGSTRALDRLDASHVIQFGAGPV